MVAIVLRYSHFKAQPLNSVHYYAIAFYKAYLPKLSRLAYEYNISKPKSSIIAEYSLQERVNAGLPTVITNSLKYVAVGTSHGYILAFDSDQNLCWYSHDTSTVDQGAVSALAFNLESTRLLIG